MIRIKTLIVCSFFLFAWSCNDSGSNERYTSYAGGEEYSAKLEQEQDADSESDEEIENEGKRKLIKNGSITFETKSVKKASAEVTDLVKEYNGYLSNQNQDDYGDRLTYSIQARIPANQFDAFFNELKTVGDRIENQNISVQDVTQEFIDAEARIKTNKDLELRYLALLNKAKSVEEMLNIERELGNLRSDIESLEGRLKYLKNQTNYSTIEILFYQSSNKNFGFFSKLKQAFVGGWNNFLWIIVGLVTSWPYLLVLAGLIFLFLKLFKRKKS